MDIFENEKHIETLNQVISEHFYRQGMNVVAESLVHESALPAEDDVIHLELFADLYQMCEGIIKRDLGPGMLCQNCSSLLSTLTFVYKNFF